MDSPQSDRPSIEDLAARIKGYATLRYDIMRLADEENALRLKLIEVQLIKNEGITKLVEYADRIFTKALPEYNADGSLKKGYEYAKSPVHGGAAVEAVAEFTNPSSRHCGNCGELGHTTRTCSNPRKEEEAPAEGKGKKKRTMKPLSPERKAQLAETLKKAREAKGKKK